MVAQIEIGGRISKWRGNICSSDSYMTHLYCLAVQAGFYSDAVEVFARLADGSGSIPAAALVIRIFSPVIVQQKSY